MSVSLKVIVHPGHIYDQENHIPCSICNQKFTISIEGKTKYAGFYGNASTLILKGDVKPHNCLSIFTTRAAAQEFINHI